MIKSNVEITLTCDVCGEESNALPMGAHVNNGWRWHRYEQGFGYTFRNLSCGEACCSKWEATYLQELYLKRVGDGIADLMNHTGHGVQTQSSIDYFRSTASYVRQIEEQRRQREEERHPLEEQSSMSKPVTYSYPGYADIYGTPKKGWLKRQGGSCAFVVMLELLFLVFVVVLSRLIQ